jgi:hypothetical protein
VSEALTIRPPTLVENSGQLIAPKGENTFYVSADEEPIDECAAAWTVAHIVHATRASITFIKRVCVVPKAIRAAHLHVHEAVRWIPFGDLRAPADRNAMNPNTIINERPGLHRHGCGTQNFEFQPRRSDGLQVPSFGEEAENVVPPPRKPQFRVEQECLYPWQVEGPVLMPFDSMRWNRTA